MLRAGAAAARIGQGAGLGLRLVPPRTPPRAAPASGARRATAAKTLSRLTAPRPRKPTNLKRRQFRRSAGPPSASRCKSVGRRRPPRCYGRHAEALSSVVEPSVCIGNGAPLSAGKLGAAARAVREQRASDRRARCSFRRDTAVRRPPGTRLHPRTCRRLEPVPQHAQHFPIERRPATSSESATSPVLVPSSHDRIFAAALAACPLRRSTSCRRSWLLSACGSRNRPSTRAARRAAKRLSRR